VASQAEQIARAKWGAEKCAAFDRQMARLWDRAAELAQEDGGAEPELKLRISRGRLAEIRLDRDEVER
jgi:hypothetical protein